MVRSWRCFWPGDHSRPLLASLYTTRGYCWNDRWRCDRHYLAFSWQCPRGIFKLYELIPGFILALISNIMTSLLDKNHSPESFEEFQLLQQEYARETT